MRHKGGNWSSDHATRLPAGLGCAGLPGGYRLPWPRRWLHACSFGSQHGAGILENEEEWGFTSDPVEFFCSRQTRGKKENRVKRGTEEMRLEDGEMMGQATSGWLSHSDRAAELGGEPPLWGSWALPSHPLLLLFPSSRPEVS